MSSDQQYIQDEERRIREQGQQKAPTQRTLEVVGLEQRNAPLPVWQQRIVNALAVVGGLAILYVFLNVIGVF